MEFSEGKNCASSLEEIWPAVMTAEDALDIEDFVGCNVRSKHTVHEWCRCLKNWTPQTQNVKLSQVDVEDRISTDAGICCYGPRL